MLLYHGTTAAVARKTLKQGLKPRNHHGTSNWEHTTESRPDCVYLTTCYAAYYAACAAHGRQQWGFIEIDSNLLDAKRLLPDEDFLEAGIRHSKNASWRVLKGLDLNERVEFLRDTLPEYSHLWEDSIKHLGNCCYQDTIPPEAITRVTVFDRKSNPKMAYMSLDPCITLVNFRICGKKNEALTRWFAGYEVTAEELNQPFPFFSDEHRSTMEKCAANQSGVKVIFRRELNPEHVEGALAKEL